MADIPSTAGSSEQTTCGLRIGAAQRAGTRDVCCDAWYLYPYEPRELVAACVVDGIGSSRAIADIMQMAAGVAARVGARRGGFAGIAGAGELVARPSGSDDADGAAVLALAWPGSATGVTWVGDCRAWSWDGSELRLWTTDQVMGQWVRVHGDVPVEIAEHHDNWLRTSLAAATVATIRQAEIPAGLTVILTSDGVHKAVAAERIEELVRLHADDPQALADALVATPTVNESGYRDDATAVVLAPAVEV